MSKVYADYQFKIYNDGSTASLVPTVTTDPRHLEAQAEKVLGSRPFGYVSGGTGMRNTMDANLAAFHQWKLVPRMMKKVEGEDFSVTLFGVKYPTPILMAPVGVQSIFHEDREIGLSKVCAEIGVPYILSTAASSTIEDVAKSNGDGKRWYQLYWPRNNDITLSLLKRAKANGYTALVVTLDTWSLAWRPTDLDNAYLPFGKGIGVQNGLADPVFRGLFEQEHGQKVEDNYIKASLEWTGNIFAGSPRTWDDLPFLRQNWDGPLILKGIQHVEDAKLALEYGCDGIVVSNHGGRQLDGSIGSLEALPEIVDAVGSKMTVLFDSGVRTGADIIKALALGAKGVLIGRPAIYGLAVAGQEGAKAVLQGLLADLYQSMGIAGISNVGECKRDILRKA